MMQHVASQSLRIASQPGMSQDLPPLDWQRHDPAEKAFYHGLQIQMDRFKKDIDWNSMQNGELNGNMIEKMVHSPGTMQLDSFVDQNIGLTGSPPPDLVFADEVSQQEIPQEIDEEDRFLVDQWPDIDEFTQGDLNENKPIEQIEKKSENQSNKHSAAMELAPSKESNNTIELDDLDIEEKEDVHQEENSSDKDLIRIRVIESFPEPISVGDGEEILLEKEDVHYLDQETANWLIESGVAEVESL